MSDVVTHPGTPPIQLASATTTAATDTITTMPCHAAGGVYNTIEDARAAVDSFAALHGYSVVVKRSRKNEGRLVNVVLACDRHGHLRNTRHLTEETRKKEFTRSRKCGCPMEILLVSAPNVDDKWTISYNGREQTHNHGPSSKASAHPTRRRKARTPAIIEAITNANIIRERAAVTLATLRRDQPGIEITTRDVYNIRHRNRTTVLGGQSPIEHLLSLLVGSDSYFCDHRVDEDGHLQELFVAYLPAVRIFRGNNDVVIMDCTYKTNRFGLPLLNIIGCTGMNSTIHLAQCYLRQEREGNFDWALERLRRLFVAEEIPIPQVILTDRDSLA